MTLTPLRDKILGYMLEPVGAERKTLGGIILTEKDMDETAVRARWFEVTHVGPEQETIKVGQYILLPHGRWSRGIDIDGTHREEDKLFLIDNEAILGYSDDNPIS